MQIKTGIEAQKLSGEFNVSLIAVQIQFDWIIWKALVCTDQDQ